MKRDRLLTIVSLLSILLVMPHVTDDIVRGLSRPATNNIFAVVIFAVWLVGTLVLTERPSGYVIMLLGGLFSAAMPVLHMMGRSYAAIARSSGGFFFVWTLLAVDTTGTFAIILSALALWKRRRTT
jgi:hypothetical protein